MGGKSSSEIVVAQFTVIYTWRPALMSSEQSLQLSIRDCVQYELYNIDMVSAAYNWLLVSSNIHVSFCMMMTPA